MNVFKKESSRYGKMSCSCKRGSFLMRNNSTIFVNVESKGEIVIPGFWEVQGTCENPLCKWSKLKIDQVIEVPIY